MFLPSGVRECQYIRPDGGYQKPNLILKIDLDLGLLGLDRGEGQRGAETGLDAGKDGREQASE